MIRRIKLKKDSAPTEISMIPIDKICEFDVTIEFMRTATFYQAADTVFFHLLLLSLASIAVFGRR